MCICINCKHVNYCRTYSFIELQHTNQLSYTKPIFTPHNTLIQINLKYYNHKYILDWDLIECLSFIEEPGSWQLK
uniref:Ycf34 n=1 Tax=Ceramothamnion japonicum TaxID=218448 RepID=A0A1C9CDA4_CERJP|nr:hypothetical protein Ceram_066 [Ceramium japonicum]AOM66342.1 hypothetical protein Ceram_066 [Ceramium japonicum]